ncbi:MAG: alanine--tRNA ligase [Paludibacteraceae bacterium]|nr:alanine--tRNA ligase [Paludibacteraceae bacterium]
MTAKEIRQSFLDFFASKQHQVIPSAPMVIKDDPTLMFTNAGMNQFKNIILGNDPVTFTRACDAQKCLRVSGKHNDLEEVGHDTYHHTMFEMLGNWSFGDYFKEGAIDLAWEYIVNVLHLDPKDLYVTVFEGAKDDNLERDNEAEAIWLKHLPKEHIIEGNKHDNFWEMGDTGPCGPCSEIHVDSRSAEDKEKVPGYQLVNKDHPQVIEIWNLVFMQYNRKADGSLENLPMKVIDTGMGFERLVRTLQGKQSNYDSDVFQPMLQFIGQLCNCQYGKDEKIDVAMRVIADHIRTIAFAIADGQLPSNAKAGYVIRRILRRAVRYGYTFLQQREAFLYKLIPQLVDDMGDAYPEIKSQSTLISKVLKEEEEAFLRTLEKGIALLDKLMAQATTKQISGVDVFTLYDTYGFPLDLTELILREKGFTCNEDEFHQQMQLQKERARNAAKQDVSDWVEVLDGETEFVGYDTLTCDTQIVRYRKVAQKNKSFYQVVLTQTPFYAEMGGEIGDSGWLGDCPVLDTKRENNLPVHILEQMPEDIHATLVAKVDADKRKAIAANHSATHILHYALRHVLGTHVEQKGSLVTADSLRFDFSHFQKVTPEELREVEKFANQMIRENLPLDETRHATMQQAKEMGAMALFGEKYGDDVRVIKFGSSVELCGGCHVKATGLIGSLRILMETSVAAGVRRIEAVTAQKVDELYYQQQDLLNQLRGMFNNAPDLINAIRKTMDENSSLKKQFELLMQEKAEILCKQMIGNAKDYNGINLVMLDGDIKVDMLRNVFTLLKPKVANIPFAIIGTTLTEDKPMISIFLSQPLIEKGLHAGNIIKSAAKHIQGGGGGQPWMATAGGRNADGLTAAKEEMLQVLNAIQ